MTGWSLRPLAVGVGIALAAIPGSVRASPMQSVAFDLASQPMHFTAEAIATILHAPLANVEAHWPMVVEALGALKILDPTVEAAARLRMCQNSRWTMAQALSMRPSPSAR